MTTETARDFDDIDAILRGIRSPKSNTAKEGDITSQTQETTPANMSAEKDEQIRAHIENNPIYQIIHKADPAEGKEERIARLVALFDYQDGQAEPIIEAARDYLYYVHMVRRTLAVDQLKATADGIYREYQQTMDAIHTDLVAFQDTIAPLREGYELIQTCNEEELQGKAEPLVERITKAMRLKEKQQREEAARKERAEELTDEAADLEKDELPLALLAFANEEKKFFGSKTKRLAAEAAVSKIRADIAAKKGEAAKLRDAKPSAELAEYDPKILKVLDVGGETFQRQAQETANTTIAMIDKGRDRLEKIVMGFDRVHTGIEEIFSNAHDIDYAVSTLLRAVKRACEKNALESTEAAEPSAPAEATDGEALEAIEKGIEKSKQRRYLASLQSFERSLSNADISIKGSLTTAGVMDQNINRALEKAMEVGTNTVATVADATAIFLHAIALEANSSSTDMVEGVLKSMQSATDSARRSQINMLPAWFRKDNRDLGERAKAIKAVSGLLQTAAAELTKQRGISDELRAATTEAITTQSKAAEALQEALTTPASAKTPAPANDDRVSTRPSALTRAASGPAAGFGTGTNG